MPAGKYTLNGEDNQAYTTHDEPLPPTKPSNDMELGPVDGSAPPGYTDGEPGHRLKEQPESCCSAGLLRFQEGLANLWKNNFCIIKRVFYVALLIGYFTYFGFAMAHEFGDEGSVRLLVVTILGVLIGVWHLTRRHTAPCTQKIDAFLAEDRYSSQRRVIRWALYIVSTLGMVTLIIVLVALDTPENLRSLAGLAALILICFLTSYNPAMIDWHPVFWGFTVQFYFAVIILKTRWGYDAFQWLGDRVTEFLAYSDAGAIFVFSDVTTLGGSMKVDGLALFGNASKSEFDISITLRGVYLIHFFTTAVMPVVVFFSCVISVLYYLGIMQLIIKVIGRFLAFCLGTTQAESLNAAGNIFISMTESPMMIRPFLRTMTRSELHAVMTGGFATIAGSVLGVYIGFGIKADHLLSASVMSAPAALAISKLTYPEVEIPDRNDDEAVEAEKSNDGTVIEAACNGAMNSVGIIASILVNVIAFLALLAFLNATLAWLGDRVGVDDLSFQLICSYLLYPVALFMGTETGDCRRVAELVGIKTFTNEFIAYENLKKLIENKKQYLAYQDLYPNGTVTYDGDDMILAQTGVTLIKGVLSPRSEMIATYALCGFANFGSMGIMLGTLSAMVPQRRPAIARVVFRAMIAGNIACFFTACVAGLFYEEFE